MSDNKRYYWLKLDENFFEDDTIQWLEEQKNGKDYVIFYLKLMLKSLKDDGTLIRYVGQRLIPYDVSTLAKITNTHEDTVAVAMKTFVEIGLVETKETGEIFMSQIAEMVGSETKAAQRMRRLRAREKETELIEEKTSERNNVQKSYEDVQNSDTEYRDTELEKELDIEKEINTPVHEMVDRYQSNDGGGVHEKTEEELNITSINNTSINKEHSPAKAEPDIPYKEIIDYLNQQADRNYRDTTRKTKDLIKARINEGFTLEDFREVIDIKVDEWKDDSNMNKYLRPETLFGTKFESYLNQPVNKWKGGSYDEYEQYINME